MQDERQIDNKGIEHGECMQLLECLSHLVASSKNNSRGFKARAHAAAKRSRSPPGRPRMTTPPASSPPIGRLQMTRLHTAWIKPKRYETMTSVLFCLCYVVLDSCSCIFVTLLTSVPHLGEVTAHENIGPHFLCSRIIAGLEICKKLHSFFCSLCWEEGFLLWHTD